MAIFITGTDTDIGKTLVSSWICLHTGADYYKPIQCGNTNDSDADFVHRLSGATIYPEAYKLTAPLSPHAAAAIDGVEIDPSTITLPAPTRRVIVEGAGGVMVPLAPGYFQANLIAALQIPVIVVARTALGTINHTCLTLEALRHRNIPVLGVIFSGPPNEGNRHAIADYGQTPILATLPFLSEVTREALAAVPVPATLKSLLESYL